MAGEEKWSAVFDTSAVELGYYRMQQAAKKTDEVTSRSMARQQKDVEKTKSVWEKLNSRGFNRPAMLGAAVITGTAAAFYKLVQAAAKESATAADELRRFDREIERVKINLGKNFAGSGWLTEVAGLIRGMENVRLSAVNGLADLIYGKGAGASFDAAVNANDEMAKEQQKQKTFENEILAARKRRAEVTDDEVGKELAAIDARARAEKERIVGLGLDPTRTRELQDSAARDFELERQKARSAQGAAEARMEREYRESVAEAWQKENDEIAEANDRLREHERYVQSKHDELADAEDQADIDKLRARGLEQIAKAEELRLKWARERRQIERDDRLSSAEKDSLLARMREREQDELAMARVKAAAVRPVGRMAQGFGAGYSFLNAQVFGMGGQKGQKTDDKLDKSLRVQEQTRDLIQRLVTEGMGGARFA